MRRRDCGMLVTLTIAGLLLAACSQPTSQDVLGAQGPPVMVEAIDGTDIKQVTLIPASAERLGIQTAPIGREVVGGRSRTVMPYAALLYDEQGDTWTYTNPEGLVYVRHGVTVDFIEGDLAILSDGPPVDTLVVTVGAAELYGAEFGVGGH